MMKPTELARWLGISPATIRLWAAGEFGRYLSPTGAGGDGRWRVFSEQDARIMALVNTLKQQGIQRSEIHAELQRLESEDWRGLPEMPPAPAGVDTERLIPERAVKQVMETQRSAADREISLLERHITELKDELAAEREKSADLLRKLAEAETELRLWREGRLK